MERPRFPLGYSASLDGARGLMTITVIAAHLDPDWYPGAIIFMDTFFIISGYLITSLLLKDWFELGRIRFARFYLRRIYRLYPALVLMLAAYLIVAALFLRPFEPALRAVGAALFYMMNWARAFDWDISTHLGHAWSLSIEEQFYVCWPPLCLLLLRREGKRTWPPVAVLIAIGVASMAWRHALAETGAPVYRLYNGTDVRLDALTFGCALGFLLHDGASRVARLARAIAPVAAPAVSLGLFLFGFHANYFDREWYLWQSSLCVGLSTVLVACLAARKDTLAHRLYEWAPAVFLGRICYGLYLWHYPILALMETRWNLPLEIRLLVGVPAALALATLSYKFVELPLMRLRPGG